MKYAITDDITIFNIINIESAVAKANLPDYYKPVPRTLQAFDDNYIINNYVVVNSEFVKTTAEKPNRYFKYNPAISAWYADEDYKTSLKQTLISEISSKREALATSPILYDGKSLDADTTTITINLPGKIKEIEVREVLNSPIPQTEMFWKDANNTIHFWTDQTAYKNWLLGLAVAISSRGTYLYAKAWEKKAEVANLTDINDIINYDVTTGW